MNTDLLDDGEVALIATALSIHRTSVRRKTDRLPPGPDRTRAITELDNITQLISKINTIDSVRAAS